MDSRIKRFGFSAAWMLGLLLATGALEAQSESVLPRPEAIQNPLDGSAVRYPSSLQQLFDRGWSKFTGGDFRGAEKTFKKFFKKARRTKESLFLFPAGTALGYTYLFQGRFEQADGAFRGALDERGRFVPALVGLAYLSYSREDWKEAYNVFHEVQEYSPGEPFTRQYMDFVRKHAVDAIMGRGERLRQAGDLGGALAAYQEILDMTGGNARILFTMGELYGEDGRLETAISLLERAVQADPSQASWHMTLAGLYEQMDEPDKAQKLYRKILRMDPANRTAGERYRALREKRRLGGRPRELSDLASRESVSRAEMAALLYFSLPELSRSPGERNNVIVTDIYNHWAKTYIQDVVALGIMEIHTNHTFKPDSPLKRYDMARAGASVLLHFRRSGFLSERSGNVGRILDVPGEHLLYGTVREVLVYNVMDLYPDGTFRLYEAVSGESVEDTVEALRELLR